MPKQVRLRRGTTAQHAIFTGAQGEVTFNTDKKCLVIHDGVTPGGVPIEGWVKLTSTNTLAQQTVNTCLRITGGDGDLYGFSVVNPASFGDISATGTAELYNLVVMQEVLPYAATIQLNFRGHGTKRIDLAGNLVLTSAGLGFGRQLTVRLLADGSARTLSFPAGWRFVGSAMPASLAAGKLALMQILAFGPADSDVVVIYHAEL